MPVSNLIIGIEAYIINGELESETGKNEFRYHLILLAQNEQGYKNLMKFSSYSYMCDPIYKPRIPKTSLKQYNEGLICLLPRVKGEIPALIYNDRIKTSRGSCFVV